MVSGVGHDDLAGKASCEVGGLGAKGLALNGLKGPRGRGSTRGRGGNRRSSLMSAAPAPWEDKERTLLKAKSEFCRLHFDQGKDLRKRAMARVVTRHRSHVFKYYELCLDIKTPWGWEGRRVVCDM